VLDLAKLIILHYFYSAPLSVDLTLHKLMSDEIGAINYCGQVTGQAFNIPPVVLRKTKIARGLKNFGWQRAQRAKNIHATNNITSHSIGRKPRPSLNQCRLFFFVKAFLI
jgi:hypothetical protein